MTSSGLMSKDFTHGWNSSNYIFRVEVDGRLEHAYTFSIDGVPFLQMQRKHDMEVSKRNEPDNDRHTERKQNKAPFAKPGQTTAGAKLANTTRRFSSDNTPADSVRGAFQSPEISNRDTYDPFESNEAADPFGEDPFGSEPPEVVSKPKKGLLQQSPVRITAVAPPVSLLDDDEAPQMSSAISSQGSFDPFGTAADPFAVAPTGRKASDFSNDLAGLSFTVPAPTHDTADPVNPFESKAPFSVDDLFDEGEPPSPVPVTTLVTTTSDVWNAPKSLVNLDLNASSASSTSNAFSGRSPSLNLLLNGSSSRPQGQTGMNAPPQTNMGGPNQGMNGQPGMGMNNGPQGMNSGHMGMNGQSGMGMNNGPMGMNYGPQGMNGPSMGQGQGMIGTGGVGSSNSRMMMGNNAPQGQGTTAGGMMGQGQGGMMAGGMMGQGQGYGMQQGQGMMGGGMQGQGQGMMAGGMQGQGQGGMMTGGMMGQGQGYGMQQGQRQGYGMTTSVNMPSTSGATSSLTGSAVARGVPSQNGPKSSLDNISWK